MISNKQKVISALICLAALTAALMITMHLMSDSENVTPQTGPVNQTLPAELHPAEAAPEPSAALPPEPHPAPKAVPEPAPTKLDALKKSGDLDMDLVDASMREYILSLYFQFRDAADKDEFLASVKAQLLIDFPEQTALKILKIYEAYLDCELKLQEQLTTYDQPETEDDMLFIANDIYEFRKLQMGDELAEKLFGQEHKITLYKILNKKIYDNDALYGAEKEMQLRLLAAEVFGNASDDNIYDKTGESLFQEKMLLYKKDFEEMDETAKKAKIREFRQAYLSDDEIDRIETAEARVDADRKRDTDYFEKKNAILNDPDLKDDEKQEKIRALQDFVYGDKADEIRSGEEFARRHNENMQKMMQERGDTE